MILTKSFRKTVSQKIMYQCLKGVWRAEAFVWIWIKFSSLVLLLNFCFRFSFLLSHLPWLHPLTSRGLFNSLPDCHLAFYLNHFQILPSGQTCTYPMIGHQRNQVLFVLSFHCSELCLGEWKSFTFECQIKNVNLFQVILS